MDNVWRWKVLFQCRNPFFYLLMVMIFLAEFFLLKNAYGRQYLKKSTVFPKGYALTETTSFIKYCC